jgi:hypothetical protein
MILSDILTMIKKRGDVLDITETTNITHGSKIRSFEAYILKDGYVLAIPISIYCVGGLADKDSSDAYLLENSKDILPIQKTKSIGLKKL